MGRWLWKLWYWGTGKLCASCGHLREQHDGKDGRCNQGFYETAVLKVPGSRMCNCKEFKTALQREENAPIFRN
jgi:hypothetical protein